MIGRLRRWLPSRHLVGDRRGLALIEFALIFPIVLAIGGWGIEVSYLAVVNMKLSKYALNLADAVSRVGVDSTAGVTQLRESDVNDVFFGARLESAGIGLADNGRVILSSLENTKRTYDTAYKQRIHWQRCFGKGAGADFDTKYGPASITDGSADTAATQGPVSPGMGNPIVKAPKDNAVMFVEVNYQYKPIFGTLFLNPKILRHTASMMVRDNRDLSQIHKSPPAKPSTCNLYTA